MRISNSIKAIMSSVLFVICVLSFSTFVIIKSDRADTMKEALLPQESSNILPPDELNTIFCGASHCLAGCDPKIVDNILGTKSLNISAKALKWHSKIELIKNTVNDFPIDTLYLEVSYDSLTLDDDLSSGGVFSAKLKYPDYMSQGYCISHGIITEYFSNIQAEYVTSMHSGFSNLYMQATGRYNGTTNDSREIITDVGFEMRATKSVEIDEESIIGTYEAEPISTYFLAQDINRLEKCVDICKKNDISVIFTVFPISDAYIWEHTGFDCFYDYLKDLSEELSCELYDFNLLKSRYDHIHDCDSFYDETHMAADGAEVFSALFADTMLRVRSGEDVSDLFYSSYEEMLEDSPYMEYYREHIG